VLSFFSSLLGALGALGKLLAGWLLRRDGKRAARLEQAEEDLYAARKQAQVAADHRADSVDDAVRELRDTGKF